VSWDRPKLLYLLYLHPTMSFSIDPSSYFIYLDDSTMLNPIIIISMFKLVQVIQVDLALLLF